MVAVLNRELNDTAKFFIGDQLRGIHYDKYTDQLCIADFTGKVFIYKVTNDVTFNLIKTLNMPNNNNPWSIIMIYNDIFIGSSNNNILVYNNYNLKQEYTNVCPRVQSIYALSADKNDNIVYPCYANNEVYLYNNATGNKAVLDTKSPAWFIYLDSRSRLLIGTEKSFLVYF